MIDNPLLRKGIMFFNKMLIINSLLQQKITISNSQLNIINFLFLVIVQTTFYLHEYDMRNKSFIKESIGNITKILNERHYTIQMLDINICILLVNYKFRTLIELLQIK